MTMFDGPVLDVRVPSSLSLASARLLVSHSFASQSFRPEFSPQHKHCNESRSNLCQLHHRSGADCSFRPRHFTFASLAVPPISTNIATSAKEIKENPVRMEYVATTREMSAAGEEQPDQSWEIDSIKAEIFGDRLLASEFAQTIREELVERLTLGPDVK
ncbi:uncharacterized protein M421DRAFT_397300 [Didymella exigua CBS 183.55]|uniref:Uncharacterized protein n=1 Tax=Didymella exigua CBS 183.55 TaxID=1150837 RepID=A0A6A5REE2_9PLEO|nr:uncharacterized protein M421DRAFT_397300 [Didymella exigua CBS 183.55]KAF1926042.1 hypothetical protein M421DRAFT_397300 [Didymella exigua CBS 183.55]